MSSVVETAWDKIAALVDEFRVTDKALLRARDRLRKAGGRDERIEFYRQTRRYFSMLDREAAEHIAHVDRTLDDLYQRQYNAQAERSVAARRLERARAVLAALTADPDSART